MKTQGDSLPRYDESDVKINVLLVNSLHVRDRGDRTSWLWANETGIMTRSGPGNIEAQAKYLYESV